MSTIEFRSHEERAAWDRYFASLMCAVDGGPACHDSCGHSRPMWDISEASEVADQMIVERRKRLLRPKPDPRPPTPVGPPKEMK